MTPWLHGRPNPSTVLRRLKETGDDKRFPKFLSVARAKICAMNHDAISAALWALSGFDPALVHLAELRERFAHLDPEEDPIRISLDRLTSVYVEGQCQLLLEGAGITTHEAAIRTQETIGDGADTAMHVLACSSDPLAMELYGYALYLGTLTAHGKAPWNRYAAVMADCYTHKHRNVESVFVNGNSIIDRLAIDPLVTGE